MSPIITVNGLSKTFDYFKKEPGLKGSLKSLFWREKLYKEAVKGISFQIEEGELVGFLGPNGAGKTTTLKMLSGILYPTSGEARVLGHRPWEREPAYQKSFAIVMGQKNQLWWDLPAQESFALNRDIYEIDPGDYEKTLHEMVEMLDIGDILTVPVRQLSLGQRMKCELVAALLHRPKILFLDEPTIGLDVISQDKVRRFLEDYNRRKKTTILLTSHYMRDVERLCRRVVVINNGEIIYDGLLDRLKDRYADHKIIKLRFLQEIPPQGLDRYGEVLEKNGLYAVLKMKKGETAQITSRLLNELPVEDLSIEEVEVEEVISRIFSE
jgi:ABC-2 type transport system ATP-binding protein